MQRESIEFPDGLFGAWCRLFENRVHGAFYYPCRLVVPPCAGVYELRVDGRVMYLGSTRNLKRRISTYQANGSHLALKLSRAIEAGKRIEARWAITHGHRFVEKDLLQRIEYPWNRKN